MKYLQQDYVRSVIFGFEDSLVSTTGLVAGIATGTSNIKIILLAGVVAVAVEAVSMAAGQYLSERTVHEMDKSHTDNLTVGALLMFFSYFSAGLIPLFPIIFLPASYAVFMSVLFAFVGLFLLGYIKGQVLKVPAFRSGIEILTVGGAATIIGVIAGYFLKI